MAIKQWVCGFVRLITQFFTGEMLFLMPNHWTASAGQWTSVTTATHSNPDRKLIRIHTDWLVCYILTTVEDSMNKLNSFHFFLNPGHFSKANRMNFVWRKVQWGVPFKAPLIELSSTSDAVNALAWSTGRHVLLTHQLINQSTLNLIIYQLNETKTSTVTRGLMRF